MHSFDLIILVIVIIATYRGWVDGLFRELMWYASIFISLIVTIKFADIITEVINNFSDYSPQIFYLLSFTILFIISLIAAKILTKGIKKIIDLSFLGFLDNALGSVFHVIKYMFVLSFVFWTYTKFINIISFDEEFISAYFSGSVFFAYIRGLAPYTIESFSWISPYLQEVLESTKEIISTTKN